MTLDYTRAERTPMSITGLRDLANDLVHPGQLARSDYAELAELIHRAPQYLADIPADAVKIARKRLSEAAGRGNALATRLLADLDRSAA